MCRIQTWLSHPRAYQISLLVMVVFLLGIFGGALFVLGYDHPYWGDEEHFAATVRFFISTPWSQAVQDYPELTGPLSYLLYAGWGRVFGDSLPVLRLLSLVLGFAAALIFHRLAYEQTSNPLLALLAGVWLFINPYVIGSSLFVFTDISALFFLVLAVWAALRSRPLAFLAAAAAALLTRQYLIFFVAVVGGYSAFRWLVHKERPALWMAISSVLSCLPLSALVVVWGGLSPVTGRQLWLHGTSGLAFYPFYLTNYLSTFPVYAFPFLIMAQRSIFRSINRWMIAIVLSAYYFFFPVAPSWVTQIETELHTIGYFHRLVKLISSSSTIEHIIFYLLFVIGINCLLFLIEDAWKRLRLRQMDSELLLDLAGISYFVVMAFSFHVWEKYLLPVLPLLSLRLLMVPRLLPRWVNQTRPE